MLSNILPAVCFDLLTVPFNTHLTTQRPPTRFKEYDTEYDKRQIKRFRAVFNIKKNKYAPKCEPDKQTPTHTNRMYSYSVRIYTHAYMHAHAYAYSL